MLFEGLSMEDIAWLMNDMAGNISFSAVCEGNRVVARHATDWQIVYDPTAPDTVTLHAPSEDVMREFIGWRGAPAHGLSTDGNGNVRFTALPDCVAIAQAIPVFLTCGH